MKHAGPIGALTELAANVGQDRTARENLQDNLAVGAFGLHQQQQEEQIRARREAEALQAMQYALQDDRQREINQTNAATRYGVADLNGQYGMQRTDVQQAGANQRTAYTADQANQRNDANNQSRQLISNQNVDSREGIAAGNQALGYYRTDQQAERDAKRQAERIAVEQARTAEQALRAAGRTQESARVAQIHASITELQRQRAIVEHRGQLGDANAGAVIDRLNAEIDRRVQAILGGSPSPQPSPGVPGQAPTPYDAQQPGMAQPAPSMSGLMQQQPVSAPGPQSMAAPPQVLTLPDGRRFRVAGHDGRQPVYEAVA